MKNAQDALILKDAPTPLIGGQVPVLNSQLRKSTKGDKFSMETPIVGNKRSNRDENTSPQDGEP